MYNAILVMIFQLQFQLQLLIFYFFSVKLQLQLFFGNITVIRFSSFSYSYLGSNWSQLNA